MTRVSSGIVGMLALGAGALTLAAALPGSVHAFGELAKGDASGVSSSFASFTPASVDPRLAQIIADGSNRARMMRFTPAGASESGEGRSVTLAVRLGAQTVQSISGRSRLDGVREAAGSEGGLRIASTRYNLGLARGYRSFAQAPHRAPALSESLSSVPIPDLTEFRPPSGAGDEPSRFAARIEMEQSVASARSAQGTGSIGDQMVNVGGSYRLTRNIDVTAGVRYQQEPNLHALPVLDKQDSQAVYVGTQFRF